MKNLAGSDFDMVKIIDVVMILKIVMFSKSLSYNVLSSYRLKDTIKAEALNYCYFTAHTHFT